MLKMTFFLPVYNCICFEKCNISNNINNNHLWSFLLLVGTLVHIKVILIFVGQVYGYLILLFWDQISASYELYHAVTRTKCFPPKHLPFLLNTFPESESIRGGRFPVKIKGPYSYRTFYFYICF